jgi:hypothetical protein
VAVNAHGEVSHLADQHCSLGEALTLAHGKPLLQGQDAAVAEHNRLLVRALLFLGENGDLYLMHHNKTYAKYCEKDTEYFYAIQHWTGAFFRTDETDS